MAANGIVAIKWIAGILLPLPLPRSFPSHSLSSIPPTLAFLIFLPLLTFCLGNDLERVAITVGALICPYLPTLATSMLGSSPRIAEKGEGETKFMEIEGTGKPTFSFIFVLFDLFVCYLLLFT